MNKEEVLNTFLLANIPEIITQEEFNDVKKAIKELLQENQKYKEVIEKVKEWEQTHTILVYTKEAPRQFVGTHELLHILYDKEVK